MKVNKYLILHSGDVITMQTNLTVVNLQQSQDACNANLKDQLKDYKKDIQESASHIELVLIHKGKL